MRGPASLSAPLRRLIATAEACSGSEVLLHRDQEAPLSGLLLDTPTYHIKNNIIVFPASMLGLLKDTVIALNSVKLLCRLVAHHQGRLRVLSFDQESALQGARQIYLDMLKDDRTRHLPPAKKKKLLIYIYLLYQETLSDLPYNIVAHLYLATRMPLFRNAQVYLLMKESMQDMHELVAIKEFLPRRYFVLYNALHYARDTLLAEALAAYRLNPLIHIPEMRKFRNLDLKEMMTKRWSESSWYHAKIAGDLFVSVLRESLQKEREMLERSEEEGVSIFLEIQETGRGMVERLLELMVMKGWYLWSPPSGAVSTGKMPPEMENAIMHVIFGE